MQKDRDRISVFCLLPSQLLTLFSQVIYFQDTRTKAPVSSGITFQNVMAREENQSSVPMKTSQGKPVVGPCLGHRLTLGYCDLCLLQSLLETQFEQRKENYPKGEQRKAFQADKNNQHLPQTGRAQGEEKGLGRRSRVPQSQREGGEGHEGERVRKAWVWRDNSFKELCGGAKAGGGQQLEGVMRPRKFIFRRDLSLSLCREERPEQ